MPKLTTGSSLRDTTITCSPFFRVKRWTGGSASSAGLGGAGARNRSVRPAQYSAGGLAFAAAWPGTFSYWTWTAAAGVAGGAAGGGEDAQAASVSVNVNVNVHVNVRVHDDVSV